MKKTGIVLAYHILLILCFSSKIYSQTIQSQLADDIDLVVSQKGTGDYSTIQAAINAIPDNNPSRKVIFIENGTYSEKVVVPVTKKNITIVGENIDSTILVYNDNPAKDTSLWTFKTYTIRVDADDFWAMNMTIKNSSGDVGQALALFGNGDRQIFTHCRFLGWQDTYYINVRARNYFKDCFIEGSVDYIFGFGVAVFDSCQIHTIRNSGTISAASTPLDYNYGIVFRNCSLTSTPRLSGVSLGRPWFDFARTDYIKCWETSNILKAGWTAWEGREATCIFNEYKCFGPGSDTTKRVSFGKQLTDQEAEKFTLDTIFSLSNFPVDSEHDTSEINTIHRRFVSRGIGHISEYFLKAGRITYPSYPAADWKVNVDQDSIYRVIKKNTNSVLDSIYGIYSISDILVNNVPISGFIPSKTTYAIELEEGVATPPIISAVTQDALVSVAYPNQLPGYTTLTITSKNKINQLVYQIYNSLDSAFWNANLKWIIYNSEKDTIYILPNVYNYDIIYPEKVSYIPFLLPRVALPGSSYKITMPESLPGTAVIKVTALDTNTTKDYLVHMSFLTNIDNNNINQSLPVVSNLIREYIEIRVDVIKSSRLNFDLFDLNGKLILTQEFSNLEGVTDLTLSAGYLQSGIYAYRIRIGEKIFTGKLIKVE